MSKESSNSTSFRDFETSIADAWNLDDDDYLKLSRLPDVKSTADDVIRQHKEGKLLTNITVNHAVNKVSVSSSVNENSNSSVHQNETEVPMKVTIKKEIPVKKAPGMGIRLTNCFHSIYPNFSEDKNEADKICKFQTILDAKVTDIEALRKNSWFGIPTSLRPLTWKILSDYVPPNMDKRDEKLSAKRNQYFRFVDQYYNQKDLIQNSEMYGQIQKDLQRMNTLQNKPHIQKLFERVLFTWSMRHPASGYVQGINDLLTPYFIVFLSEYVSVALTECMMNNKIPDLNTAGEITLETDPSEVDLRNIEADCFWCVSRLLDSIQDHYTFAQPGIQQRVQALASLISRLDSELHQHLTGHRIEYLQFAFRWMNNLLMRELPLRCVIRLWDTYHSASNSFAEFHVYVCAAFMLKFAADLKREKDFQGLMLLLQNLPTYHWTDEDISLILADAFKWKSLFGDAPKHLNK